MPRLSLYGLAFGVLAVLAGTSIGGLTGICVGAVIIMAAGWGYNDWD